MNPLSSVNRTPSQISPTSSKRPAEAPVCLPAKVRQTPAFFHNEIEKHVAEKNANALLRIQHALKDPAPEMKAVAFFWLGTLYLRGLWLPQNTAKALHNFKEAAASGSQETKALAHTEIGTHLRFCKKYAEALGHFEIAKDLGSVRAAESAELVKTFIPKENDPLTRALRQHQIGGGHHVKTRSMVEALFNEAEEEFKDRNLRGQALEKLKTVARSGERPYNAEAAVKLARSYFFDFNNSQTAHTFASIAIDQGNASARAQGWLFTARHYNMCNDLSLAVAAYREACSIECEKTKGTASLELGCVLISGDNVQEGLPLVLNATEHPSPQVKSAALHYLGKRALTAGDLSSAEGYLRSALKVTPEPKDAAICLLLAESLMQKNPTEAFFLLGKAAKGAPSLRTLAITYQVMMLAQGKGVDKNPEKAYSLYKSIDPESLKRLTPLRQITLAKTFQMIGQFVEANSLLSIAALRAYRQ
ncbi:MAG: SEL1-like repeat protein [Chlamydiia bacterium]|nr:SEL1-like repeat protein [Chlamydiia bacterium]